MPVQNKGRQQQAIAGAFGFRASLLIALVVLPLVVIFSLLPLKPPAVVPADAGATEFSAARASEHIGVLATAAHPIGTPEHAEVRGYIERQIEALGLEPQIHTETVVSSRFGSVRVARVKNILARLLGQGGDGAILLVAHYDTVAHSPGASDDSAGVAVLLETMRALRSGPALRHDVILLFTDAEEIGLMGARAFEDHPWLSEVDLVLNFEARGASGPSIMFETGAGNRGLMKRFAASGSRPLASSYAYDVYRFLPNDTDFSIFKRAEKTGFNFAFINDVRAYHSSIDSLERIDLRSVQHHGANALELTRDLGDADFETLRSEGDSIYFNVPLLGLVVYPLGWALPLLLVLLVVALVVIYRGFAKGKLRALPVLAGILGCVSAILAAIALVLAVHQVLIGTLVNGKGLLSSPPLYRLAIILVAVAAMLLVLRALGRRVGVVNLAASAALLWLLLTLGAALYLPSSSNLLFWPLLFTMAGLAVLLDGRALQPGRFKARVLFLLLAVPSVVLWAPVIVLVGAAFGVDGALILAGVAGLAVLTVSPQAVLLTGARRGWGVAVMALALGLGLALGQSLGASYDAARPRTSTAFYALDSAQQQAFWASYDRKIDRWNGQFLGDGARRQQLAEFLPRQSEALVAEAPLAALQPATVVLAEPIEGQDEPVAPATGGAGRTIRLFVESPRQAAEMFLDLRSLSPITAVTIDGQPVDLAAGSQPDDSGSHRQWIRLYGLPGWTPEIEVALAGDAPLSVGAIDRKYGLPKLPGFSPEERPANLRPSPYRPTDLSLVRSNFEF